MERRAALKWITLAALSPKLHALGTACPMPSATEQDAAEYKLQFFTEEENQLLDQLMELIIPADAHSPGAHAALTSYFADLMVATSQEEATKKQWRDGLRLFRDAAKQSSLSEVLRNAAENEEHPKTELQRFFVALKQMTINGYYTSEIGIHQDLQYVGNAYLPEFPGCTHPEHD